MNTENVTGTSLPRPLTKWWLRAGPPPIAANYAHGEIPGAQIYVPWWAWPLELLHRAVFGKVTLQ